MLGGSCPPSPRGRASYRGMRCLLLLWEGPGGAMLLMFWADPVRHRPEVGPPTGECGVCRSCGRADPARYFAGGSLAADFDAPAAGVFGLGQLDAQHAVAVAGRGLVGEHWQGQRDAAMEAAEGALAHAILAAAGFLLVVFLAAHDQHVVAYFDIHVLLVQAGYFQAHDELVAVLEHIAGQQGPVR